MFKQVGTDSDPSQRERQAMLGCAPAHKLLDVEKIISIAKTTKPRDGLMIDVSVNKAQLPDGVELIEYI